LIEFWRSVTEIRFVAQSAFIVRLPAAGCRLDVAGSIEVLQRHALMIGAEPEPATSSKLAMPLPALS